MEVGKRVEEGEEVEELDGVLAVVEEDKEELQEEVPLEVEEEVEEEAEEEEPHPTFLLLLLLFPPELLYILCAAIKRVGRHVVQLFIMWAGAMRRRPPGARCSDDTGDTCI